jgi:uncharacterized phage protein (TIGR02218 family)
MSGDRQRLRAHLATGDTSVCRCWQVVRADGVSLGFTDHDRDLTFDGVAFRAGSGLSGRVLQKATGLSVDNSAAMGTLSSPGIRAEDVEAGRFDGAEVTIWKVNWADPEAREVEFRGTLGEITRSGIEFEAELRGLTEALNRTDGRVFQRQCTASLGDRKCGVDMSRPEYRWETEVLAWGPASEMLLAAAPTYPDRWFAGGSVEVQSGDAAGLAANIKQDVSNVEGRRIVLWEAIRARIRPGDLVALVAGCDRAPETCRAKFSNFINFRGFPHVPGDDWVMSYPARAQRRDGGSRSS